jgi:ADP-ribosylation factor GTPase-activating protein 2/3
MSFADRMAAIARYPEEVVIAEGGEAAEGGSSPDADEDDFFSSWDKPAIKKPTPPLSRTSTPPVVGRTGSPFLNAANGKEVTRSTSPLTKSEGDSKPTAAPTVGRVTTSAALRKTTTTGAPRKANVLGAKKTTKLGAKKITADLIDFDEAEKKAKEEAERREKLGYDPEAEEKVAAAKAGASKAESSSTIHSLTPVNPAPRAGYGSASRSREKSASEMERLGMGVARLGFGQIGGNKGAAAAQKKNAGGFGSVGPIKAAPESMFFCPQYFLIPLALTPLTFH